MPVVIIGSVDQVDDELASVDGDERQAGKLLAEHMLKRGYEQFVLLMSEVWRSGDHLFLEGVQGVLQDAGLSIGALRVRGMPDNPQVFRQQVRQLIAEASGELALICQNPAFIPLLDEMQQEDPAVDWKKVGIAFNADTEMPKQPPRYPCTYQQDSDVAMTGRVVKMLIQLSTGIAPNERHVVLPMALHDPEKQGDQN